MVEFNPAIKQGNRRSVIRRWFGNNYLIVVFILLIITSSLLSKQFLTLRNVTNIMIQNSAISIIAFGMLLAIMTRGIDLSVGSVVALAACLASGFLESGFSVGITTLFVLSLMVIPGLISGSLIGVGKIEPFVATLSMMMIVRGVAYIYQVGSVRVIFNQSFISGFTGKIGFIPIPVFLMLVVAVVITAVLKYTTFGRRLFAIGGNPEAARLVGISYPKNIILVYAISSFLAGLAGIIMAARLRVGTALVGEGMEMDAIAAVVIGGAPLSGGKGTVYKTLLGAFIIGVMGNMMNLFGVAAYPQMVIKGVIIVFSVLAQQRR